MCICVLFNDLNPALRSFDTSHLNAGESIVKLLGDRPHFLHSAGEADLLAVVVDLAYGGDYGSGTAQTALGKIL